MGTITYNEADFQKAAIQFDRELIKIPHISIRDTTKFMTVRKGIRGIQLVGQESVDAEFSPYRKGAKSDADLNLTLRPLATYFGALNAEFDPNEAMNTLLDHRANQAMGDGLESTPTAREVLGLIAKQASAKLAKKIFSAKRNPKGTKTEDLFDGFDTLTQKDIDAGLISEEVGNLTIINEQITEDNAYPIITSIIENLPDELRDQQLNLYCSRRIADLYNRSYKKHNSGIPYNNKFEQSSVEGSSVAIVPLPGKKGSDFIHITTKANMLVGTDQESDQENVKVKEFSIDTLTFMMRIFFGVQFKSIHHDFFHVAKIATAVDTTAVDTTADTTDDTEA